MIGNGYIFCRPSGAMGLGHVGGAFQLQNGLYRCFGTENPTGGAWVPAAQKGFWVEDHGAEAVVSCFKKSRKYGTIICPPYNFYKIMTQQNPDYNKALQTLDWCGQQDYLIASVGKARTCEDDVCDTLSAYGLWMPWTITYPAPNAWFGVIAAQLYTV